MNRRLESTTAVLAAAFGGMLFGTDTLAKEKVTLDPRTAKELAVISRVLEKRLSDFRKGLTEVTATQRIAIRPQDLKSAD